MRSPRSIVSEAALALLGAAAVWHLLLSFRAEAAEPRTHGALRSPAQEVPAATTALADRIEVRIEVNSTTTSDGAESDVASVCRIPASPGEQPWGKWVDLGGARLTATSTREEVPVYSARTKVGVALVVANHSDKTAAVRLDVKLDRGIHRVEKHCFGLTSDAGLKTTERLQGINLKVPGALIKPISLPPKTAGVICIVDETYELGRALEGARVALRQITGSAPRAFRVIHGPFGEAVDHIAEIAGPGGAVPRDRVLTHAERATLSLSHAQTLFKNFQSSGELRGDAADGVGRAFDRLDAALAEVTAAMLGLVPNCVWAEPEAAGKKPLSVQLANHGSRTLRMIKVGLVIPDGCRVSPEDQAIFRAVRPGESIQATFVLQPASPQDLSAVRAEFSYVVDRAPAHLRIKTQ